MGAVLVHAQGAGQHAAADDGHARQFQQPLDSAVLAVFAMENRKGRVEFQGLFASVQQKQRGRAPVQPQGTGPPPERPNPLPGDVDRQGPVLAFVQMLQDRPSGLEGGVVFAGTAAVQD